MCFYCNSRCFPACIYDYICRRHCCIEVKFRSTLRIAVPAIKCIICIYGSWSGRCEFCIISIQRCCVFYGFVMLNGSTIRIIQFKRLQFAGNIYSFLTCLLSLSTIRLLIPEFSSCWISAKASSCKLIQIIPSILLVNS